MKAKVKVTLKNGVLDPQGKAIEGALGSLGFAGVNSVRQGKYFEISLVQGTDQAVAAAEIEQIAKDVLANPVIEDYQVEFFD